MIKVPLYLNGTEGEMPCPCCGKILKDLPRPWEEGIEGITSMADLVFSCDECGIIIHITD